MAQQAIGMIETRGLVPLVQAADAALKAANVTLTGWRRVGSGLCTIFLAGDVAAVRTSVDAGCEAARHVGEVVRVHVIPRPHDEMATLLPNEDSKSEVRPPLPDSVPPPGSPKPTGEGGTSKRPAARRRKV